MMYTLSARKECSATMDKSLSFIDLKAQYQLISPAIQSGIDKVLEHGQYILGPEVRDLEQKLGNWTRTSDAVGVANGTDALVLALRALGIGAGDVVFTSSFSFFASSEAIALVGATPAFTDIDAGSYNMCAASLRSEIAAFKQLGSSQRLAGIIAVDLFGLPADYEAINVVAQEHGIPVIEDGAQSFGASRGGVPVGAFTDIATTSFFPAKPLGCYGDGGAVFSVHEHLLDKVRSLRVHGKGTNKYDNVAIGTNSRLDTIQAAILLVKLEIFAKEIELRNKVASKYIERLNEHFVTPSVPDDAVSTWAQFCLRPRGESREAVLARLNEAGIPSAIYYKVPLHLQPAMAEYGYGPGTFENSESASDDIFSIPMHPYLTDEEIERITHALIG